MRIAIHIDGLVIRFGRIAPEALAMLENLARLGAGLNRSPRAVCLQLEAVRFHSGAGDRREAAAAFRDDLVRSGLDVYFQPLASRAQLLAEPRDLRIPTADAHSVADELDMFLTANIRLMERAHLDGVNAYHIRGNGEPGKQWLSCVDIPRRVEETLRIPTARPMSASARTGALVSTRVAGGDEARSLGNEAIRADPNAEWVLMGNQFVLYTEDTDFEDRLVDEKGYQRLSFSVHRKALVIEQTAATNDGGLLSAGGFSLAEQRSNEADVAFGTRRRFSWAAVRFTVLSSAPATPPVREANLGRAVEAAQATLAADTAFVEAITKKPADGAAALFSAVGQQLPRDVELDLMTAGGAPVALTWFRPFRGPESSSLLAVFHDSHLMGDEIGDREKWVLAMAFAIALERSLASTRTAPGIIYGLRLAPIAAGEILKAKLLALELTTISAVVEIAYPAMVPGSTGHLSVQYDQRLQADIERAVVDPDSITMTPFDHERGAQCHLRVSVETGNSPQAKTIDSLVSLLTVLMSPGPR